ncbi:hypothetical protein [Flavobacterium sp.]|jgi:hypothetical protein|uniref:hypothetical protein n=1 Tax=Flavobacterium sp. TaxID=239 RepID=UPI0037BF4253
MKKLLPFASYLFHPLFVSFYAALIYFAATKNFYVSSEIFLYLIQIVIITILIPITLFFLLLSLGKIDSIMVEDLGQRKLPLLINASLLLLLIHKSITISNLPQLYFFFLGGAISTIIALVAIYLQTKISLHMIGITSLTSFIFGMSIHTQTNLTYTFAFFVVVIGWVASSRLVLKAHTIKELSLGFITGLLPQLFLWRFWL